MARRIPKAPLPNLPQHKHPAPYFRLMTIGDGDYEKEYEQIAAQLKQGDRGEAARKLLEIALDETYYEYWNENNQEDPRLFTRMHAVGVLGMLGEEARFAIEPLLVLLNEEDDYLREEMPFFYATMGPAAIPALAELISDPEADSNARNTAGDALVEIAEKHPETHDEVVRIVEKALSEEKEDIVLNAFLIANLMDLGSVSSVPLIRQAFEDERVEEVVLQMADVEEHFDLPRTTPRKDVSEYPAPPDGEHDEDEFDEDEEEIQAPYVAPVKVGRNDPCPCGSGKKYKKCCGASVA